MAKLVSYNHELCCLDLTVSGQKGCTLLTRLLTLSHALTNASGQTCSTQQGCFKMRQEVLQQGVLEAACSSFLSECWSELECRAWQETAELGARVAQLATSDPTVQQTAQQSLAACNNVLLHATSRSKLWIALANAPQTLFAGLNQGRVWELAAAPLAQLRSAGRTLMEAWMEALAQISESLSRTMVAATVSQPDAQALPPPRVGIGGGLRLPDLSKRPSMDAAAAGGEDGVGPPLRGAWLRALRLYTLLHTQVQQWVQDHHMPWQGASWKRSLAAAMSATSLVGLGITPPVQRSLFGGAPSSGGGALVQQQPTVGPSAPPSAGGAFLPGSVAELRPMTSAGGASAPGDAPPPVMRVEMERAFMSMGMAPAPGVPSVQQRQAAAAAHSASEADAAPVGGGAAGSAARARVAMQAAVEAVSRQGGGQPSQAAVVAGVGAAGMSAASPRTLLAYYAQAQAMVSRRRVVDTVDECAASEAADAVTLAAGNKLLTDLCHLQLLDLALALSPADDPAGAAPPPVATPPVAAAPAQPQPALVFRHRAEAQQALVEGLHPERLMRLALNPVLLAMLVSRLEAATQSKPGTLDGVIGRVGVPQPQRFGPASVPRQLGGVGSLVLPSSSAPPPPPRPAASLCSTSPRVQASIMYGFTQYLHYLHHRLASTHFTSHAALFPTSRKARQQATIAAAAADEVFGLAAPNSARPGLGVTTSAGGAAAVDTQMPVLVLSELPVGSTLLALTTPTILRHTMGLTEVEEEGGGGGLLSALAASKTAEASALSDTAVAAFRLGRGVRNDGWDDNEDDEDGDEDPSNPVAVISRTMQRLLPLQPTSAAGLRAGVSQSMGVMPAPPRYRVHVPEPGAVACAVWPLLVNDASDRSTTTMLSPLRDMFQVLQAGLVMIQAGANTAATTLHKYPSSASMKDLCLAHAHAMMLADALKTLLRQAQMLAHSEWYDHAQPLSRASHLARALSRAFASSRSRSSATSARRRSSWLSSDGGGDEDEEVEEVKVQNLSMSGREEGVPPRNGHGAANGRPVPISIPALPAAAPALAGVKAVVSLAEAGSPRQEVRVPPFKLLYPQHRPSSADSHASGGGASQRGSGASGEGWEEGRPSGRSQRRIHPMPQGSPAAPATPTPTQAAAAEARTSEASQPAPHRQPLGHTVSVAWGSEDDEASADRGLQRAVSSRVGVADTRGGGGWRLASADPDAVDALPSPLPAAHLHGSLAGPSYARVPRLAAALQGGSDGGAGGGGWVMAEGGVRGMVLPAEAGVGPCPSSGLVTAVPLSAAQLRVMEGLHLHTLHMRAVLGALSDLLAQEMERVARRLVALPAPGGKAKGGRVGSRAGGSGGAPDASWPPRGPPPQPSKGMSACVELLLRPLLQSVAPLLPASHAYLMAVCVTCILALYQEKVRAAFPTPPSAGSAAGSNMAMQVALDCALLKAELERHREDMKGRATDTSQSGISLKDSTDFAPGCLQVVGPVLKRLLRQISKAGVTWRNHLA